MMTRTATKTIATLALALTALLTGEIAGYRPTHTAAPVAQAQEIGQ